MKKNPIILEKTVDGCSRWAVCFFFLFFASCSEHNETTLTKNKREPIVSSSIEHLFVMERNPYAKLVKLIDEYFSGKTVNLLYFEGTVVEDGDSLSLGSNTNHTIVITGSLEFVAYTKKLLQAYNEEKRLDWLRERLHGKGRHRFDDTTGFIFD